MFGMAKRPSVRSSRSSKDIRTGWVSNKGQVSSSKAPSPRGWALLLVTSTDRLLLLAANQVAHLLLLHLQRRILHRGQQRAGVFQFPKLHADIRGVEPHRLAFDC